MRLQKTVGIGLSVLACMDWFSPIVYTLSHKREDRFTVDVEWINHMADMLKLAGIPVQDEWCHFDAWNFAVPEGMGAKARAVIEATLDGASDAEIVAKFGPKQKVGKKRAGGLRQIVQELRDL